MREEEIVTGIILYTSLVGEYDKRLVILTRERGKITVFANGARRPNSTFRAASQSFVMGNFTVKPGREAYNLIKVDVREYFSELALDMEKMCYASYFCEFMSYYTREGDMCTDNLNLLYLTFKALIEEKMPVQLIRNVYEQRLMQIEGQGIFISECIKCKKKAEKYYFDEKSGGIVCEKCAALHNIKRKISGTVLYALYFVASSPLEKIFTFTLTEEAVSEFSIIISSFRKEYVDRNFKSLEILSTLS